MISIFRATLSPLLLLSSPKVRNADTRKSSGEDRHSANLLPARVLGWVCAFPVPFVKHRLTLQRQAAVANRGLQGNFYSSPSSAKLEMGPQGHCGAGNRLCLFRREVLLVEQNPSPAAQRQTGREPLQRAKGWQTSSVRSAEYSSCCP